MQSPIAMKPVAFLSHRIDSSSPLYGKSQQDLLKERGFLVISLSAVDDQTLQTLHSRMLYHGKAICFGHAFEVGCLALCVCAADPDASNPEVWTPSQAAYVCDKGVQD